MSHTITPTQVKHVADLANIPITKEEEKELAAAFSETLATVSELQSVDVNGVEPTHQVTGLENILREDQVDENTMFTQDEALANAKQTYQGYFVVERIIDES